MFLKRTGFPEEGEIVFCTVTKIQYHAITVMLDEYDKPGLIPISEISPGRIRNIREFVQEEKKIVCKVMKVNSSLGQIDVSLRRVNESQKRAKTDSIKQEQKAEKIVIGFAEKLKKPVAEVYAMISQHIMKVYPFLYIAFDEVVESNLSLQKLGLEKDIAEDLEAVIKEKIKPKQVQIVEKVTVKTYSEEGLSLVKETFAKAKEVDPKVEISYLGGGSFRVLVVGKEYKQVENLIAQMQKKMTDFVGKKGTIEFARQEA